MAMQDVNRRNVLQATSLSLAGLTLLGTVPTVSANEHEPPSVNEVTVSDENVEYIEANPDAGFHYPYFLYTPPSINSDEEHPRPILVGPNNTPSSEDGFGPHLEQGQRLAEEGRPRAIAERLSVPLLVPVFPRFREEPEPWYVYVQVIDPDTFIMEDSPLERVDTQLLEMVDDATSRLETAGHTIASKIHIDGFSASGTFSNRFTILYPERVNAASHGGTTAKTLPKTEIDDDIPVVGDPQWNEMSYPVGTDEEELPYPIGVANLEELTGTTFNEEAWLNTPQYIYIGNEDRPEPGSRGHRSFSNLYDEEALQVHPDDRSYGMPDLIDDIYGVQNIDERFEVSRAVYENVGAAATFRVYEGYGHTPRPAIDDLVEFHQQEIVGTYGSPSTDEETSDEGGDGSANSDTDTDTDTDTGSTDDGTPGFGVGVTLGGLAGASYVLKHRLESES